MEDWHLPLLAGKCFPRAGRGKAAGLTTPMHSPIAQYQCSKGRETARAVVVW